MGWGVCERRQLKCVYNDKLFHFFDGITANLRKMNGEEDGSGRCVLYVM